MKRRGKFRIDRDPTQMKDSTEPRTSGKIKKIRGIGSVGGRHRRKKKSRRALMR